MRKELVDNAASAVASATSPIATPAGGLVTFWTWLNGHDISWYVGMLTIVVLLLQIRDRIFPRKEKPQ
ncbi:hypothetical protein IST4116A_01197 [Burkholderia cenocepacia]|uniref:hypothetical protein n=1 Tax=Burkholderia cenocepacia TaxID=95486 RepID=UPI0019A451DB|nr:hypothetical protein [Burkholderia cenocepacia]CAB5082855.1 hypothetical protein IST4116B_01189 [Burkholderia cenocepacia]CAB5083542.1 hypothetical protein IST4134_01198 [Burkholderia cenocepacia]CAB5087688.1 hypothetical protein IST4113_01196 [Burkholderia cenocepacia]CAB5095677.1 hypothetical protein IST439_01236 [Burkholderia cenocepacia]CAB5105064.1 hypothetical protein IST4129_01197 [Burkholderia cenocepacia]